MAGQVLASHGVDEEQLLHLMDELIVPGEEILQQDDPKESPRLEYILEKCKERGAASAHRRCWNRAFAFGDHA